MATASQAPADNATSEWLTRHPTFSGVVLSVVVMSIVVIAVRVSLARWRAQDAARSERREGLRNAVGTVFVGTTVLTLLLPRDADLAQRLIVVCVYGGFAAVGALHLLVLRERRRERLVQQRELISSGLPVRRRLLSWKVAGLLCAFVGPLAVFALAIAIAMPVTLAAGGEVRQSIVEAIVTVLFGGWLIVWGWLMVRQWHRQRREDKRYWTEYWTIAGARAGQARLAQGPGDMGHQPGSRNVSD